MTSSRERNVDRVAEAVSVYDRLHPLHTALLCGTVPLFLGGLLSDVAYVRSYEVQWKNFASWLIVAGLLFCGLTLLWALVDRLRGGWRVSRRVAYFLLLLAVWVLGFVNALVHAADAWASMPAGLILSALTAVLVVAATWLGIGDDRTVRGKTP
jgi:uncharacterized membrane protein